MGFKGVFTPGKSASSLALVRTKYNIFLFCLRCIYIALSCVLLYTQSALQSCGGVSPWYGLLSHCPFCKWTRNCKQNHMCAKVIHSLVHPFNRTRVCLEADWDHLFSWVSVRLFGPHLRAIAVSHLPKISAPRGKTNLSSIQLNQTRQVWIHPKTLLGLWIRNVWICKIACPS